MKAIYGRKVGMTRVFTEKGESVPVTVLQVGPNIVHQVKTKEAEGYSAVQVGFGTQKLQRISKAMRGHLGKANQGFPRFVGEVRLDKYVEQDMAEHKVGDIISIDGMFPLGGKVDVFGITVGKGFAGVVKRHLMKGNPATRGTHEYRRHGGSIGNRKYPGRVFKNKRMGGHMGCVQAVQEGLEVVSFKSEEHLLLVRGSVPGPRNGYVMVRSSVKRSLSSNRNSQ